MIVQSLPIGEGFFEVTPMGEAQVMGTGSSCLTESEKEAENINLPSGSFHLPLEVRFAPKSSMGQPRVLVFLCVQPVTTTDVRK